MDGLSTSKVISNSPSFGEGQFFSYSLESNEHINSIHAKFIDGAIRVYMPLDIMKEWTGSDSISLTNTVNLDEEDGLSILIEKDFQCLKKRPGEDERDTFMDVRIAKLI